MRLILVRHGETYWNKERRVQGGDSDIELNDVGLEQSGKLVAFLKDENIAAVVSSPLKRATVTAEVIARQHQLSLEVDGRLKELGVGELEGLSLSNLSITFTQLLMQWWQGEGITRLPGGESLVELQERAWVPIERLLVQYTGKTVVVVTHYFVIVAIILKALNLASEYAARFMVSPCGISILEFREQGTRLLTFNDTSYLGVLAGRK